MTPASEDSFPLSALQHFAFCPRQCALIHVERQWAENSLTAQGRVLHDRAHEAGTESRGDLRIARALPLQSASLGLHGVADVVEFHRQPDGTWRPFPVEYKRGRPKSEPIDAVQLCAQAVCLEEMLGVSVPAGALFYGATKRRLDVVFDAALRAATRELAVAVAALIAGQRTPPPVFEPKCRGCSLLELCRPQAVTRSASAHLARLMAASD
ncbi:CRISPR-associated protein Cas4 [Horticoccus sp. 23ND18S-11]|uniref:CRISPR-associated protein Cas4 n=1 Tax=Horticoccus sp. 23ND18S-11 TaxID=3391832 RepID=UPI0039C948CA